ncbi:hypothetical protein ACFWIZ_21355 [Streptomyces sp. NPDC127044]
MNAQDRTQVDPAAFDGLQEHLPKHTVHGQPPQRTGQPVVRVRARPVAGVDPPEEPVRQDEHVRGLQRRAEAVPRGVVVGSEEGPG